LDRELLLELPNDIRSIEHAVEYVMRRCNSCAEVARRLNLNFRVGLTEAISNAMLYGNGDDPTKRVRVEVSMGPEAITVQVTDEGTGFDPLGVPDPTCPENLLREGGRGIFLMRALMDDVQYNDRGNSVTLHLRLSESPGELAGGARA
jgi:serine/threonine-protein kinase RsbW